MRRAYDPHEINYAICVPALAFVVVNWILGRKRHARVDSIATHVVHRTRKGERERERDGEIGGY